jgi:RHS repeat-associated protein
VLVDVTAIPGTSGGSLTVSPLGVASPAPANNNVNFAPSKTTTSLLEVPLGSGGALQVVSHSSTAMDVAVDVEGYTSAPASGVTGMMTAATPARICDTRSGTGTACSSHPLASNSALTIQVTGTDGIPSTGVSAVAANLTALSSTAATSLTAYTAGTTRPTLTNVTVPSGTIVGNRVLVPVNAAGQITVYNAAGTTNIGLDVEGWVESGSTPAGTPSLFNAETATRICDTRTGSGLPCAGSTIAAAGTLAVQVTGVGGVPAASAAITGAALNITVYNATATGSVTVFADGTTRPSTTDVNFGAGKVVSNYVAITPLSASNGKVDIYNQTGSTDVTVDVLGYYTAATAPTAPSAVTATGGNAQATVSWVAPTSNGGTAVTGYTVTPYIGTTAQLPTMVSGTTTSTTITGLTNGTSYTFQVKASNVIGTGPVGTSPAVVPATVPGPPTGVAASAGNAQATVTWAAPSSNGGSAITGYTITPYIGMAAQTATNVGASPTSATVTGLTNGTAYTFTVIAKNAVGSSTASSASNAVTPVSVPGAPTNVTATGGNAVANVSWTAPAANGGSAITGYTVTPYIGSSAQTATSVGPSPTSATITGLSNGTAYTFQVAAVNAIGTGPYGTSNLVTPGPPGAPTSVTATGGVNSASISWTAPTDSGGGSIAGYVVTAFKGSTAQHATSVNSTTTTATLSGLQGGTSYTFKVAAYNSFGNGATGVSSTVTPTGASTTYASTVLGDSPIAYFRLGDSGSVAAASAGGAGSYVGGVTEGHGSALASDADPSVQLDGSSGYVDAGLANQTWNSITVEAWFMTNSLNAGDNPRIVANSHTDVDGLGFQLSYGNGGGSGDFGVGTTGTSGRAAWTSSLTAGQWHHYVGTYDGSTVSAYIDGILVASAPASGSIRPSTYDVNIGRNPAYNGDYFNGAVDEVAIYPTALTAAQVTAHYNASGNNTPPPAPTTVTATAGANQAAVTWSTVSSATRYSVTAFAAGVATNTIATDATGTGVTMTGLRGGVAYTFQVVAINQHGTSPPGTSAAVTPTGAATTYASTVQGDGPAAYYRLDDPSGGVAADSSGNGRSALYDQHSGWGFGHTPGSISALANDPDPAVGNPCGSYCNYNAGATITAFPGTGLPQGSSARSLEGWFRTGSTGTLAELTGTSFRVRVSGTNQLQVAVPSGTLTWTTAYQVTDSNWHLVEAVFDGTGSVIVYLDGQSLGTQTGAGTATTATGLCMAGNADASDYLNGSVDEVALYDGALTPAQVAAHWTASGNTRPAVASVSATAGANQATVTWSAGTAGVPSGESPVTGYTVTAYAAGVASNSVATDGSTTSVTMTGLRGGIADTFQVVPHNAFGPGSVAASAAVTPSGAASTYASTVQGDGPAAYYRLDDPSGGVAADSSGNGRSALYDQHTNWGASHASGAAGALATDSDAATAIPCGAYCGYGGGATVANASAAGLPQAGSALTVEGWFKTGGTGTVAELTGTTFRLRVSGPNQLQVSVPSGALTWTTGYPVTDSSWHLLQAVYDGTSSVTLYLDGQSLGAQTGAGTGATATGLCIGGNVDGTDYLNGSVDEIAVFSNALSTAHIGAHWAASGDTRPTVASVSATAGTNQATVTWAAGTAGVPSGASQVTIYTVTAYAAGVASNSVATDGTATSVTISGLRGGTAYAFRVLPQNQFGLGPVAVSAAVTPTGAASTYASTVQGDTPAAYYRLDDPSGGVAADSSGNGRSALYDQHSNWGASHAPGAAGALATDSDAATATNCGAYCGYGGGATIANASASGLPLGSAARTLEGWFRTVSNGTVVEFTGTTFRIRVSGQNQLQVYTPGGTLSWTTLYSLTDNTWHLVEAVDDGSGTVTVYLDGLSQGSQAGAGAQISATGLCIGGNVDGTDYVNGAVDEVAVYGSALSAAQITAHYGASGDTRPTSPPRPPSNVTATGGDGQVTVSWTASSFDGGSPMTGYTVTPYIGSTAQTATTVGASMTSTTISPLTDGTTYTFQVTANNAVGSSTPATSNAVTPAVLPGAPTNVKASASDARASVTWTAPGAPGNLVNSYTVTPFIGTTAQTALAVTVTSVYKSAVTTSASVGGLTDGTTYTFQVTATNGTGTGPPGTSGAVTPVPTAPLVLAPSRGYNSGAAPVHASIGDVTGSGFPAIVTANGGGNSLSALLNQVKGGGHAGGTFAQPATQSSTGAATSQIALGDFNGDGKLDAAVVSGTGAVGVMLGTGNGGFAAESGTQTLNAQTANVVAVADLNHDGKPDIVVAGGMNNYPYGTAIDVLMGNGDGTFQAPVQYPLNDVCLGCAWSATGLTLADLNGDGFADIVYTTNNTSGGSDGGELYTFVNSGSGTFTVPSTNAPVAAIPGVHSSNPGETVAVADINGDGIPDIVTVEDPVRVDLNNSGGQRGISISLGSGDGSHFLPPVYVRDPALTDGASPPNDAGDVTGIAIADMNGDGHSDIVTSDSASFSGPGGISVYLNPGGGGLDVPRFIATPNFSARGLALGDLNGDREPDVVLQNNLAVGSNVLVLLNGTDFPPLGGALGPNEMHGCLMCQAMRGGGALDIKTNNPVTVNSGEMSHTFSDISVPARGFPLSVSQTYNDLNAGTDAGLGYGWWSPLLMSVTQDSGTGITAVTQENGGQAQFWTSSLQPVAPRTQATLVHNGDGTWTFRRYNSTTLSFDSSGKITSMTDLTGDSLTFAYTGGQVTSLTHSDGRSLSLAWANGHLSSITDSNVAGTTRTVSLTYDGSNQLTDIDWKVNGANDRNEHFEYETAPWNHGMTGMRDPRGIWVTQVYDAVGRTTSQTVDPTSKNPSGLNQTTTFAYTLAGSVIAQVLITDPAGHQDQDTFAYGEMIQKITGYGTPSAATWTYSYDPSSVGTTMTIDPNGGVSSASYDTNGNPLATTDALGRTASSTYTGNGGADGQNNQPTTVTDPNGVTTTNTYDASHRTLTQTSTPLVGSSPAVSQVIQYQHTNASHPGDVTGMIDGDGKAWTYGYDAFGNKSSTTDPVGNKSSMAYNADGWVLTTITPKGDPSVCTSPCTPSQYTTTYSYVDGSGNTNFWGAATTVTDPLGHHTVKVYDSNNNVTQLTDGNGNVTAYDFDNANESTVVHRSDANHTTVTTDYNADGTVRDQIDGKGNTLQSYTYNSLGQQTAATADPGSSPHVNQTTAYAYDALGNVLTKQAPAGSCTGTVSGCTTYTYDAASQLTGITYSDGATPNVSTIQYDADGQQVAMTDGTGSWAWQYDSLHRLTSVTEGTNGTVAYQYNLRNEPTTITYPGTTGSVTRGYDNAGRWTSVQDWKGAQTTFGYDGNSNLQTQTTPTTGTSVVDTSAFNAADQLTSISSAQGATSVFSASYGRDGNRQVTSDTSATTGQNNYGYSPLNQLCYAGTNTTSACSSPPTGSQPFTYDASGNLTSLGSTTQAFNTADQLTTSGTSTYQYDSSGNRTGLTAGSSVTNYGYNQANRLCWTGPTASGSACNAGAQSSDTVYCYNATGLRMAKVTAGSCASPTTSEAFTWDVSAALPLLLVDGSAQYVYGPGGLPLEQVNGAATLWYHHDQIGSTRAITDGAGALKATYTYDPYGNVLSCSGTAVTVGGVNVCTGTISVSNPLDFSGQYRDGESGNYYLRARSYDPTTAQFLSRDPMVATTRAPYAYTGDNPLNRIDPNGLGWCRDNAHADGQACSTVAGSTYSGPTKSCIVIGGRDLSTDSVEVEAGASCQALSSAGSSGPTYQAYDPADEGRMPAGESCSFDPGTGLSHCDVPSPEPTAVKIFSECLFFAVGFALAALGVPDEGVLAYHAAELAHGAWEVTHWS